MDIIFYVLLGYLVQVAICGLINIILVNKIPGNAGEFLKMTFLPTLIYGLIRKRFKAGE